MKTMGGKGKTRTCQQNLLCIVQLYARVIDKLTWKDASPSGPPRQRPGPGPVDFTCLSNNCSHHFLTFSVVQYRPNFSPCLHQTESFPHLQEKAVFIVDQGRRACLIYKATSRQGWWVLPDIVEMRSISLCSTSCIVRICSAVHQLSIIGRRDTVPTGLGLVGDERNCGNNY